MCLHWTIIAAVAHRRCLSSRCCWCNFYCHSSIYSNPHTQKLLFGILTKLKVLPGKVTHGTWRKVWFSAQIQGVRYAIEIFSGRSAPNVGQDRFKTTSSARVRKTTSSWPMLTMRRARRLTYKCIWTHGKSSSILISIYMTFMHSIQSPYRTWHPITYMPCLKRRPRPSHNIAIRVSLINYKLWCGTFKWRSNWHWVCFGHINPESCQWLVEYGYIEQ